MGNVNNVNGNGNGNAAAAERAAEKRAERIEEKKASAQASAEKVTKTDTVEISKKSEVLAAKTATQDEPNVEKAEKKVTAKEKSKDARKNYRQAMKKSQHELKSIVKDLKKAGVGRREIGSIIKTANREANKTIGNEMRQSYKAYRGKEIDRDEFKNKLYGSAVKKLDSIVTALKDKLAQKTAPADKNTEAVKEKANETKSKETTRTAAEKKVDDADDATREAAKDNAKKTREKAAATLEKAEKAVNGEKVVKAKDDDDDDDDDERKVGRTGKAETADEEFGKLVDFFNDIDKMINGFADEVEGKGKGGDEGESTVKFAARLNEMFSGINKAFGRDEEDNVGHKLGVAQMNKETIGKLFDGGHGSGAINKVGDAGEGSGNFNAVRFMDSMSRGINEGLNAYKEVQEKVEQQEAKERVAEEEAVVAGA